MAIDDNRIITKGWLKSSSNLYTEPLGDTDPNNKALTVGRVLESIPEVSRALAVFYNLPEFQCLTRSKFKFIPFNLNFGNGFNHTPLDVSVNVSNNTVYVNIVGQFTTFRKISDTPNCNRIINISNTGEYTSTNWGGSSNLGFTGGHNQYEATAAKGIAAVYFNNKLYQIIVGNFSNYSFINRVGALTNSSVGTMVLVDGTSGLLMPSRYDLPYPTRTHTIKENTLENKPHEVYGTCYTGNNNWLVTKYTISQNDVGIPSLTHQDVLSDWFELSNNNQPYKMVAMSIPNKYTIDQSGSDLYIVGGFKRIGSNYDLKYIISLRNGIRTSRSVNITGGYIADFDLQSDGKIIIIGYFSYGGVNYTMHRLNKDFSIDTSFTGLKANDLNVSTGVNSTWDYNNLLTGIQVMSVVTQKMGPDKDSILIGGRFSSTVNYNNQPTALCGIKKFNKYGTPNNEFGLSSTPISGGIHGFVDDDACRVEKIKLLPDGSYIMVGLFDTFNGRNVSGIANLSYEGNIVN